MFLYTFDADKPSINTIQNYPNPNPKTPGEEWDSSSIGINIFTNKSNNNSLLNEKYSLHSLDSKPEFSNRDKL